MPQVSIVIPAYNAANYISKTVDSVLAQTFTDWELIVVDDGSSDDTRATVANFTDSRIKYLPQENRGAAMARNRGWQASRGRYLIFLDADDYWDKQCLELLTREMNRNADQMAAVHSNWAYVDGRGRIGMERNSFFSKGPGLKTLLMYNPFPIHAVLITRDALEKAGGFTPEMPTLEDWELWLRMAARGVRFFHLPRLLAFYHWHTGSKSKDVEMRKNERLATLNRFWTRADLPGEIASIKRKSFATAYIDFCVSRLNQSETGLALEELDAAIRNDSSITESTDTYYRIIFANQSASRAKEGNWIEDLDGTRAAENVDLVLNHLEQAQVARFPNLNMSSARFAALYSLGLGNYNMHCGKPSRRYLWMAWPFAVSLNQKSQVLYLFFKTYLPRWVLLLRQTLANIS